MKRPECVVSRQRAYLAILSALPLKAVIQGALEAPSACRLCASCGQSVLLSLRPESRFAYFRFCLLADSKLCLVCLISVKAGWEFEGKLQSYSIHRDGKK